MHKDLKVKRSEHSNGCYEYPVRRIREKGRLILLSYDMFAEIRIKSLRCPIDSIYDKS